MQHLRGQLAGRRVLLARVIGTYENGLAWSDGVLDVVSEGERGARADHSAVAQDSEIRIERDAAERDDHAEPLQQIQLAFEIRAAIAKFVGVGLVVGRS